MHVNLAENSIGRLKRRMVNYMRSSKTQNWKKFLPKVTKALNSTVNASIGGLKPIDVQGEDGDSIIIDRLKVLGKYKPPRTLSEENLELKKDLKKRKYKNFRPGSYVLLDISSDDKKIEKSYALKVIYANSRLPYSPVAIKKVRTMFSGKLLPLQ